MDVKYIGSGLLLQPGVKDPRRVFTDERDYAVAKKNDEAYTHAYMEIGAVANTHGVRGEIKVFPHTFDVKRFAKLDDIILVKNGAEKIYVIENVKYLKQFALLKFKGVDDMNGAALLKGALVCIPKDMALPLGADEYYIGDIIGCRVYGLDEALTGEITGVLETAAHDIYEIKTPDNREILIPAVKRYVREIDIKLKKVRAETPEMYLT